MKKQLTHAQIRRRRYTKAQLPLFAAQAVAIISVGALVCHALYLA